MKITHCVKCGGDTPEGLTLCPPCMRQGGAGENEVSAAAELLDIASVINIGDTGKSQYAAINSILKIKSRLEGATVEKEKKEQAEI